MRTLLFLLLFLLLLLLAPSWTLDFRYHSNREMEQYLLRVNASHPDITHLYSIGRSVRGQQLWVLALGVTPHRHTVGIPEFKYVANMHGNEVLGRVLLLHLIDDLVRSFNNNETWAVRLLHSVRIHILPTMNPDGFDSSNTDCVYSQGRYNANGVDLNRNFPDAFAGLKRQQEPTRAVMSWLQSETFVLSANLHGGALVASYPYDNSNGGQELVGGASVTPDDDVFVHLAKVYSFNHASMHRGDECQEGRPFQGGVTNGYHWYPLAGGMQDYNYVWAQCLDVTLEVSCCKFPPAAELPALWSENRKALLAFIQQVHLGVKGRVLDGSGTPVQNAVVEVRGRRNMCPFRTDRHGEYYRLLLPGKYSFTVTYLGHEVLTETLSVPHGPDDYSAMRHDFLLRRVAVTTGAAPQNATSSICNQTPQEPACGGAAGHTVAARITALSLLVALRWLID
uniref:Carboxypeptidase M n=1 Tax=Salarias fasciatus TaxID=181472 RepID=A0A672FSD6_SALFA